MHKERAKTGARRPTITPLAYQLPEEAHIALMHARDHLRLLARLTEPRTLDEDDTLPLSHAALAQHFTRLATDLDHVVRAAHWPGSVIADTVSSRAAASSR